MTRRRLAAAAIVVGLLAGGCAPTPSTPSQNETNGPDSTAITTPREDLPAADAVVKVLAAGISALDVSKVATVKPAADAQAELKTIFAGMDGLKPKVAVGMIQYSPDEDKATAKLTFTYPKIGLKPWTYESVAPLVYASGAWKVDWTPTIVHPQLTAESRMRHLRTFPTRAPINDAAGLALVEERTLFQVGIDKARVTQAEWPTAAADLAKLLAVDAAEFTKKVLAGGAKQFVVAKTMEREQIPPAVADIPGGKVVETKAMVAASDAFAASLIGKTGLPSKELIDKSKGQIWASDTVGLSGLQLRYDTQLRGVPEVRVDLVGRKATTSSGEKFEEQSLFLQESSVGSPLDLSLNRDLQTKAETVLAGQPGIASLVVIRPSDGALLAAANSPSAGVFPHATFGKYAPGSTFKVVSSLAMLRSGLTPTSAVKCPASLPVAGHNFGNYSDYPGNMLGSITLTQALAHSCNTAFAAAAAKITPDQLHAAAGSLGVGTDYDAGFTSNFGTVQPNNSAIDRAASMIGQGQITMSPMGMAAVAASVASGKTTIPWLVKGKQAKSTAAPLTAAEAANLKAMMTAVVNDGSGRVLKGLFTGAKTGTAEWGTVGAYKTHGWMIAWNANYAVAAFVETGVSGSKSAAPLIKALFS